jgi:hypothetical protein
MTNVIRFITRGDHSSRFLVDDAQPCGASWDRESLFGCLSSPLSIATTRSDPCQAGIIPISESRVASGVLSLFWLCPVLS